MEWWTPHQTHMLDYNTRKQISQEMSEWLNKFNWDWYCTLTFRFQVKDPINAKKYFHRFLASMSWEWFQKVNQATKLSNKNKEYFILRYNLMDNDISYFVAVERFKGNFGTHLHCLLSGVNDIKYVDAGQIWFQKYGFATIEKYLSELGANYYLTKYITKELCDWDIYIRGVGVK